MALNIKDDSVHEAVKRITLITGDTLSSGGGDGRA